MASLGHRYRKRGGYGAEPHDLSLDQTECPACQDCGTIAQCDYCKGEGTVSPERARLIDMMLGAGNTPRVGEVSER